MGLGLVIQKNRRKAGLERKDVDDCILVDEKYMK